MPDDRLHVVLGGAFPAPGGPQGTWGRALGTIVDSEHLRGAVRFTPYRKTLPEEGGSLRRLILDATRFLRALSPRPDLVHLHVVFRNSVYREVPMLEAARLLGIPTVCDVRTGGLQHHWGASHSALQNAMLTHVFKTAGALVCECAGDVAFIESKSGRRPDVVPSIMPAARFHGATPADLTLRGGDSLKLVFIGRFIREKGLLTMIEGLKILSERRVPVELHLDGWGDGGQVDRSIADAEAELTGSARLINHGRSSGDILEILARYHVFTMLTSWPSEGHPNALLEAMTVGLGLLLSPWRHLPRLAPEASRIEVPPDDSWAFADAVEDTLNHPERLLAAGRQARAFVRDNFLDSTICPRLLEIYRRAVGAGGRHHLR
ncbi:MAG: glycosyltransferase family 4 protein [Pseudomonadota bacterium]